MQVDGMTAHLEKNMEDLSLHMQLPIKENGDE
jgi:hypothetical protein